MSESYWVTFDSPLPEDPHPKGWSIALRLVLALRTAGVSAGEPNNWRDSGYSVNCVIEDAQVHFFLSHIGRPVAQWVLCCTSDRGFFWRFLYGSVGAKIATLARLIDEALKSQDGFSSIRWYPGGWKGDDTESWEESPRALRGECR